MNKTLSPKFDRFVSAHKGIFTVKELTESLGIGSKAALHLVNFTGHFSAIRLENDSMSPLYYYDTNLYRVSKNLLTNLYEIIS